MDHGIELNIPVLEILEIEVSNMLYNPGNMGSLSFSNLSYPGNIGNLLFPISDMVEMRAAGERLQGQGSAGLVFFRIMFLDFCDISNLSKQHFSCFLDRFGVILGIDGDGDDGVPTTLICGQTPGPSRPGTKYPVRGRSLTSAKCWFSLKIHI